jgi:flavin reductase (DIM6/NTAB) family NADH-FMN oxidoreductase RutF
MRPPVEQALRDGQRQDIASVSDLEPRIYRDAMSHVAGAVHVVATSDGVSRAGFTATAVASVSDRPPVLLVCANAASPSTEALLANGVFSVNTLSFDDEALAEVFAGRTELQGDARFEERRWTAAITGAPLLIGALVSFECRLIKTDLVHTHHIVVGEVVGVRHDLRRRALIYRERAFQGI